MRGYIYVLVNSSLPGLVKIGKTTRSPSERVGELSGATGVPMPFVIAYEQLFEDCGATERHVHAALAERGARLTANREFFTAKPADVIRIIMSAPGLLDPSDARATGADGGGGADADEPCDDPLNGLLRGLLDKAASCEVGDDGVFQGHERAYQLYARAASLGSAEAYERMGVFHMRGLGTRASNDEALECFKRSIDLGNFYALSEVAKLHWGAGRHVDSMNSLWALAEARKAHFKGRAQTGGERALYAARLADVLLATCRDRCVDAIQAEIIRFGRDIAARVEHLKAEHERAREEQPLLYAEGAEWRGTYDAILAMLGVLMVPRRLAGLGQQQPA